MPSRVLLLTPARRFISNRYGVGFQIPLGLVLIGGPLVDAGHTVRLIDNDLHGWNPKRLIAEIRNFAPDCIMMGHTGSTAAHHTCLNTARFLREAFPNIPIAYGGVYPSYAWEHTLNECPAIDIIVRGEAEQTAIDLVEAWEKRTPLTEIPGIAYRENGMPTASTHRPPIADLDAYRPGWELVEWEEYELFGFGRSAGMQFSRGCPLTCTYCGQWMFWKKWRHRSPENFVEQLRILAHDYGVKIVWMADENFGADRDVTIDVLNRLIEANLGLSLNINMTAADVARDADIMHLYKAAGVDYVVMGIESLENPVITSIRKNNPFDISKRAVQALRENSILALTNIIYGLEDESLGTIWTKFRKGLELDSDVFNACYLTPHFWTAAGRGTKPQDVIQLNQERWTYRNQVIEVPKLSPLVLFIGVKLTEFLFHMRPKALMRLITTRDARLRKLLRQSMLTGAGVLFTEITEFFFKTNFAPTGSWEHLPGSKAETHPKPLVLTEQATTVRG